MKVIFLITISVRTVILNTRPGQQEVWPHHCVKAFFALICENVMK